MKDDGGRAFPNTGNSTWDLQPSGGMTLRDWFAGQALAGVASQCDNTGMASWLVPDAAERAYELADAMLAARTGDA